MKIQPKETMKQSRDGWIGTFSGTKVRMGMGDHALPQDTQPKYGICTHCKARPWREQEPRETDSLKAALQQFVFVQLSHHSSHGRQIRWKFLLPNQTIIVILSTCSPSITMCSPEMMFAAAMGRCCAIGKPGSLCGTFFGKAIWMASKHR
jgi:hypothetical protein